MIEQAIILAAGEGQRLRPFTAGRPKVMLKVGGKPVLEYVIEALRDSGIRDIVIVSGYHREQIYDRFGGGAALGVHISYCLQEQQAGTAHALAQATGDAGDRFLVLPGDHYIDYRTLREICRADTPAVATAVVSEELTVRYGVLDVADGVVRSVVEKPREPCCAPVSTGIFAFDRSVFDYLDGEADIPGAINRMTGDGIGIAAVPVNGPWLDIVFPGDILTLNAYLLQKIQRMEDGITEENVVVRGAVSVGAGARICSGVYLTGPASIGEGCYIGPGAVIGPYSCVGSNTRIGPQCVVENAVIGDDVEMGAGCVVSSSVVDDGCRIDAGFRAPDEAGEMNPDTGGETNRLGSMIGANCRIGPGVVSLPGAVIGNGCKVAALKVIEGFIDDGSRVI